MRLRIWRFNGGWAYSVAYQGRDYLGWGMTRAAALAARTVAVNDVFRRAQQARVEVAA